MWKATNLKQKLSDIDIFKEHSFVYINYRLEFRWNKASVALRNNLTRNCKFNYYFFLSLRVQYVLI